MASAIPKGKDRTPSRMAAGVPRRIGPGHRIRTSIPDRKRRQGGGPRTARGTLFDAALDEKPAGEQQEPARRTGGRRYPAAWHRPPVMDEERPYQRGRCGAARLGRLCARRGGDRRQPGRIRQAERGLACVMSGDPGGIMIVRMAGRYPASLGGPRFTAAIGQRTEEAQRPNQRHDRRDAPAECSEPVGRPGHGHLRPPPPAPARRARARGAGAPRRRARRSPACPRAAAPPWGP